MVAQQKLRELAAEELRERVHLERELARQQQPNLILQKQNEIERHESLADKRLFKQKMEMSVKSTPMENLSQENVGTPPQFVATGSSDSDTPPFSQNRPKPFRQTPVNMETAVVTDISLVVLACNAATSTGKLPAPAQVVVCSVDSPVMATPGVGQYGDTQLKIPAYSPGGNVSDRPITSCVPANITHVVQQQQSMLPAAAPLLAACSVTTYTTKPAIRTTTIRLLWTG